MIRARSQPTTWIVTTMLLAGAVFCGACSAGGGSSGGPAVTAMKVGVPVEEPVWDRDKDVLLALAQDEPRIVKIDPETGKTDLSGAFEDVGENLAISPGREDNVYLPQPKLGRIASVDVDTLRKARTFKVGSSPTQVATDMGSDFLFALSEDGSTVTGVDLENFEPLLPSVDEVEAGKEAELEGPERGLALEFFVAGPRGIALYEGHSPPLEKTDHIKIAASTVAGDVVKVSRVYVGEEGTNRLLAVDLNPKNEKLTVSARKTLSEPVEYVGTDEKRVYAATEDKLIVLKTENFEGFDNDGFEVVDTINYRRPLKREALKDAPLTGLAVGPTSKEVYLTLKDVPYVISIDKPDY
jgi:hypothetical protein